MYEWHIHIIISTCYGVALVSRNDKIIGLFCKRALLKRRYPAKETYDLINPTDCSHSISVTLDTYMSCVYMTWVLTHNMCLLHVTYMHTTHMLHNSSRVRFLSSSVLQRVAVCCSVLQCVAVCFSVLQHVIVCYSVLQRVAVCCSVLQYVAVCCSVDFMVRSELIVRETSVVHDA